MTFNEAEHPRVATGQFTSKATTAPAGALTADTPVGPAVAAFDRHMERFDYDLAEEAAPAALDERARELVPDASHIHFELNHTDEGRHLVAIGVTGASGEQVVFSEEEQLSDDEPLQRIPFNITGNGPDGYVDGTDLPGMEHVGGDEYRYHVGASRGATA